MREPAIRRRDRERHRAAEARTARARAHAVRARMPAPGIVRNRGLSGHEFWMVVRARSSRAVASLVQAGMSNVGSKASCALRSGVDRCAYSRGLGAAALTSFLPSGSRYFSPSIGWLWTPVRLLALVRPSFGVGSTWATAIPRSACAPPTWRAAPPEALCLAPRLAKPARQTSDDRYQCHVGRPPIRASTRRSAPAAAMKPKATRARSGPWRVATDVVK